METTIVQEVQTKRKLPIKALITGLIIFYLSFYTLGFIIFTNKL